MELFKFQVMFFVILVICVDAKYIATNFSVPISLMRIHSCLFM